MKTKNTNFVKTESCKNRYRFNFKKAPPYHQSNINKTSRSCFRFSNFRFNDQLFITESNKNNFLSSLFISLLPISCSRSFSSFPSFSKSTSSKFKSHDFLHTQKTFKMNSLNQIRQYTESKESHKTTPLMAQYFRQKALHPGYLLLFRVGDFFEMFFDDAIRASQALDITLTKRGRHHGVPIPMAGIPVHALDTYLNRLIKKGIMVAVCEQTESPEEAKKQKSKVVQREVRRLVTPGTITEENFLQPRESNYLLSMNIDLVDNNPSNGELSVGFAWAEMSTGEFYMMRSYVSKIHHDIAMLNPSEILISQSLLDIIEKHHQPIYSALKDYVITIRREPDFHMDAFQQFNPWSKSTSSITKSSTSSSSSIIDNFSSLELSAAGAVLSYVNETQKGKTPQFDEPTKFIAGLNLEIDPATRKSLELTSTLSGTKRGSLLSVIDRTVSAPGARLLASRLTSPSTSPSEIQRRLVCVRTFYDHPKLIEDLRDIIKSCFDMERSLQRLSLGRGGPRDLSAIGSTLDQSTQIKNLFKEYNLDKIPELKPVLEPLGCEPQLVREIGSAIVDDPPFSIQDGNFIVRGYSAELDESISLRENGEQLIKELEKGYRSSTGINSLRIRMNNILGHFIEVTTANKKKVPEEFVHYQSTANTARYKTSELSELETRLNRASKEARVLEINLFDKLAMSTVSCSNAIKSCARALALLDLYSSLALLASERGYAEPVVTDGEELEVRGGRHPVVEAWQPEKGDNFVPNDCCMDSDARIWLITGPNMGGKSTFLRQNAIIAIMAQMGSFVPATDATIGVVDKIFSRVGASDDLAHDKSTFMVEMLETANIVNKATRRSLVIMDEVGRGTATNDGYSLAFSIVEYLHFAVFCRTLFATHFHELSNMEKYLDNLKCYSVGVKEMNKEIAFTHKILPGAVDESYGIHVARLAGIPNIITDRADEVLDALRSHRQLSVAYTPSSSSRSSSVSSPIVTDLEPHQPDLSVKVDSNKSNDDDDDDRKEYNDIDGFPSEKKIEANQEELKYYTDKITEAKDELVHIRNTISNLKKEMKTVNESVDRILEDTKYES